MNWLDPSPEILAEIEKWLVTRPAIVQKLARDFPPFKLYRLKTSGQRVTISSMNAKTGHFTVEVRADFNLVGQTRGVFGIKSEDLEECDLPEDGEIVGTANLTVEEIKAIFAKTKPWPEPGRPNTKVWEFRRADWPKKSGEELYRGDDE